MSKRHKKVVLDKRTSNNLGADKGDFVTCCNCGKTMLVNVGTDKCPECKKEALTWADAENEEVSDDFFHENDDYVLADTEG